MAELVKVLSGHNTAAMDSFLVKVNTTITKGDPVVLEAGYIDLAAATERVLGVAAETVVQGAAATKSVLVIVDPTAVYKMISDEDTTALAAAHAGTYFDMNGATGATRIDSSSTSTTGQFMLYKFVDASNSLYVIAEPQMTL